MKPITNILFIATLICYVFLPLCELQVKGDVTGLAYSAAMITENFSLKRTVFALLPFIACFGGIVFNCMKNRYWGIVVTVFVLIGLFFFYSDKVFLNVGLQHAPDVIPNEHRSQSVSLAPACHAGVGTAVDVALQVQHHSRTLYRRDL